MKFILTRKIKTTKSAIGEMYLGDAFQCYTLEPPIPIPVGVYKVIIRFSSKHGGFVPGLVNVPDHTEIEIHVGNKPEDTEGCILVGHTKSENWIGSSMIAFAELFPKIAKPFYNGEEVWLEIK